MAEDFTRGLFKTFAVLRPYHLQIVIGGGWAPFLYYRYLARNREHTPVLTRDIDFMVRHQVPLVGPKTIDEILTKEAELKTVFKNRDNPAVIHYEGAIDGIEVEIEFLTDQTGSQEEKVLVVQKGLHAEALRYISIIVENTLLLEIDDAESGQGDGPLIVQVPKPAAYIFQKGLSFLVRRDKHKASKDLYYIFDILAGIPDEYIFKEGDFEVLSGKHPAWFNQFISNLSSQFESTYSEGPIRIVEQRPADAFTDLNDDQLRNFAHGIMEQFIKKLKPFVSL
ncbi:MAG: nucleotidyltransferase domain-containing protein [Desulfatitalea sp.]|nr:nucleotidyltransferase domain-containing protein [Desulfatitalea sp.]